MSNANKIARRHEKKTREPRVKKVKVDMTTLTDAVIDGKLIVPMKGRVVFVRELNGKRAIHEGHVTNYDESTGDVGIWDETRQQCWSFNATTDATKIVCKTLEVVTSVEPKIV